MGKAMIKIIPALLFLLQMAAPAAAQTTAQTATDEAVGTIMDTIFNKEERRIIDDYIKNRAGLPGSKDSSASDDNDDDDARKDKDRKNKKKKNKGRKAKGKNKQLPPGLAKRKQLPPGLQRHLEKHHALPPGLAVRELPDDLAAQLPPPVEGTDRIVVEDDIVLIEKATGRILDIILGRGTDK